MTVDFTCQRCDGSFEVEFADLIEDGKLQCPNCDQKAPGKLVEEFAGALDELFARTADLRTRFHVSVAVESDDLPPPYDEGKGAEAEEEDEDEEDVDEDEDEDLDEEPEDEDEDER
jgi:DNA-directed RNA polymerase subunit RPC12/RpoP